MLTKEAILQADDLPIETVEVREWGGSVTVRSLTLGQRDEFEDAIARQRKGNRVDIRGLKARLVLLCCPELDGVTADELGGKSAAAVERIYHVAARLNGLTDSDVEEIAGNSESGPAAASPSS